MSRSIPGPLLLCDLERGDDLGSHGWIYPLPSVLLCELDRRDDFGVSWLDLSLVPCFGGDDSCASARGITR